jgi:hypothetical protein
MTRKPLINIRFDTDILLRLDAYVAKLNREATPGLSASRTAIVNLAIRRFLDEVLPC